MIVTTTITISVLQDFGWAAGLVARKPELRRKDADPLFGGCPKLGVPFWGSS